LVSDISDLSLISPPLLFNLVVFSKNKKERKKSEGSKKEKEKKEKEGEEEKRTGIEPSFPSTLPLFIFSSSFTFFSAFHSSQGSQTLTS